MDARRLQLGGYAMPYPPEVRQGRMVPEQTTIGHFIELRNAYSVLIGIGMLGNDVHGHFRQIKVGPDACRGGNPRRSQYVADHPHSKVMCCA